MDKNNIALEVKNAVIQKLGMKLQPEDFTSDTSLNSGEFSLDSVQSLELLVSLEKKFNIMFDDNDITADLFSKLENLILLVEKNLKSEANI